METKFYPYLLPIRCLIFLLIFIIASFITEKNLDEISNIWSIVASVVNIAIILLLVFITRKNGGYKKLINYEKGKSTPKQITKMIFIILFLGMGGMYLAGFLCYGVIPYFAPMMIAPIPLWIAIINILILPISTALAEDGLYLGCGVNQIKNKYIAIFVPAFFFALQHSFIPTLFDVRYIVYRFLSFLPLTILLCMHYHKHRNPLPIIIGHALIDVFTVAWILITSAIPDFYEMMLNM
ncbi:MAG: CPBP family intramembrane metalloprotease [Lachnospiraceae bacterium]|nr:CPBP family intramembrane metalloprotease [Lachnospiraceae bacterium]